jgi:elongation factor P
MYLCGDLKKGLKIEIDGEPYAITQFQFVKPGKGQALYKCKLKNMVTGSQFDRTYRSGEKFTPANLEEREMEYLYMEGETLCFMDSKNYEQEFISKENVGDLMDLLIENVVCNVLFFQNRAIDVTLPNFVELEITHTDPWVKGDTATGSMKPATIETGYEVQVPPFIEQGEFVKIDTRTKEYSERVKK